MLTIGPDQRVDDTLTSAKLLDTETQNWFDLLHHYESDAWNLPAPTAGLAERGTGWGPRPRLRSLGEIPVISELLLPEGSSLSVSSPSGNLTTTVNGVVRYNVNTVPTMYALRRGFTNPADNREYPIREARSITPVTQGKNKLIEAGLGFSFFHNRAHMITRAIDRSTASYMITLSLEGEEASSVVARRVEQVRDEKQIAEEIKDIDVEVVRDFMQIYRDAMWGTVFEPA